MLVSGRVSHRPVHCNKNVTRKENVTAALYRASADLRILKSTDFSDAQKPLARCGLFVGFCCSKMRGISPLDGGSKISATQNTVILLMAEILHQLIVYPIFQVLYMPGG